MNYFIGEMHSFQQSIFSSYQLWNKEISKNDFSGNYSVVNDLKREISSRVTRALAFPIASLEEEAELLITVGQASLVIEFSSLQNIIDRICKTLEGLKKSPLKARLYIVLYAMTRDEEDLTEALEMMEEWRRGKMSREEKEAIIFFEKMKMEELI